MRRSPSFVALVGNGLSVAANPELALDRLTRRLVAGNEELRRLVESTTTTDAATDFEIVIGHIEARLAEAEHVAVSLIAEEGLHTARALAFKSTAEALWGGLYLDYCGQVLNAICDLTTGALPRRVVAFGTWLRRMHRIHGQTAIYTLNYDVLLERLLFDGRGLKGEVSDLFSGLRDREEWVHPYPGCPPLLARPFDPVSAPPRAVRFHHLHGCVTYLEAVGTDDVLKLTHKAIREHNVFGEMKQLDTPRYRPCVILGSGKAERAAEYPFVHGFRALAEDAQSVSTLVIAGYSFRDEPVNVLLREAAQHAERVIVIDRREDPLDRARFQRDVSNLLSREILEWHLDGITGNIPLDAPRARTAA
ncbi:MAG TPA: SIR2 family protein [Capillimicrobium sp.]|nr:SIR2 family protein [Capillimicrobium sp.]